jgi:signal transduction histidine kinase
VDEVSKRPAAGDATSSGKGGLGRYLRDRPIWVKLGLIMIVPTIATVFVGFSALLTNIRATSDASTVRAVAALNEQAAGLADALQAERASANSLLGDTNPDAATGSAEVKQYTSLFAGTDSAVASYRAQRAALPAVPGSLSHLITSVDTALDQLKGLRDQTQARGAKDSIISVYGSIIQGLLDIRQGGALIANDSGVSRAMQTANALSNYKENIALERIEVDGLLMQGPSVDRDLSDLNDAVAAQKNALKVLMNLTGSDSDADFFKKKTSNSNGNARSTMEKDVLHGKTVEQSQWDQSLDALLQSLRTVEKYYDGEVNADAEALRSAKQQQVLIEAGLLLGLVLIAVLIAWLVARSMNRSLRELRHGALAIAQYGLPQAVARLRDPSLNTALSPHQIAQQIAEPLPVRSSDEFGQVTEAFNAVHLEAVRTAAEQAALRSSVATMFVNLARRSQILVDRLIGHLDRLERGEEDPDRLAELFQLDHLATRMRRNDENLLVLAGADSTRVQREPAALIDVLRAAQSEVEHYTRIEFGVIDRDIEIAAHAVNDLVHLVAELFDNATAFSPPDSTVVVEARRVGDRAVLYVEDHGIGISPDQLADLNERLATPPMVDVAVSRMMGLVVVARLAVRHSVKVELRPAHERGTIADVLLPTVVLVPRALAGRGPMAGLSSGREEKPADSGRSPYTPLALESGTGAPTPPAPSAPSYPAGAPFGGFESAPDGVGGERNLPPWSDLTGAGAPGEGAAVDHRPTNGARPRAPRAAEAFSTGGDHPPRPDHTTEAGATGLFPRYDNATAAGVYPPAAATGLPLRRAGENEPGAAEPAQPVVPRQMPSSPEVTEAPRSPAWAAAAEAIDADVVDRPAPPAASPPPAWPPAPPPASAPAEEEAVPVPVPERVAAALDITSEMPRVRNSETAAEAPADDEDDVPAAPLRVTQHADETMELPIFRELESAWFRTSFEFEFGSSPRDLEAEPATVASAAARESGTAAREASPRRESVVRETPPSPAAAPSTGAPRPPARPTGADRPAGPDRSTGERPIVPAAARTPVPEAAWRSAADPGWQAAQAAAAPHVDVTTDAGLPRRTPMAQLVPGGVEKPNVGVQKRSPEQVRGLLSAYHRGVQRGRSDGGASNSADQPPGGKEQEA